ncbi:ribosome maturation factor RimP [Magnetovibrio sp.]|uniref:ribosome maturation factor RimP n=1 Tax=Magnetovibrio sp. TaxID=2024836 RepID=UPI002F923CFD
MAAKNRTDANMDLAKRIEAIIAPSVEELGFEIVRVQVSGAQHPRLQIMAERMDGTGIDVEDCATISRTISATLDVEDPFKGEFTLEVSSPGIDRPLTRLKDFQTWAGFDAKIEMQVGVEGRKRYTGRLLGLDENEMIQIESEEGEQFSLPFDDVQRAKLLLTDELLAAATTEQTK